MSTNITTARWLTTEQVAERSGYAVTTLRAWRSRGDGPPYEKPGGPKGHAKYPEDQFVAWMQGKRKRRPVKKPKGSAS